MSTPSTEAPHSPVRSCRTSLGSLELTETLGVPVHALIAATDRDAAPAAVSLFGAAPTRAVLVTFANPGTVLLVRRSPEFRRDLLSFDFVLPDGIGMCLAMRWLHRLPPRRVSFDTTSLAPEIFSHACEQDLSIALVGGAPGIAEAAAAQIADHFPGIRITGAFDGYGDADDKAARVLKLKPDIVICGMGSGKQEAFLLSLKERGWRGWGFTCGGYLDQLQAGIRYYPRWIDAIHLRWAYRLIREPGRLWRRYLIDYSQFGLLLCAALASRQRSAPITA